MSKELELIAKTGLTITAKVFNTSGAQVGADVTCTDAGSGIYQGDMPTAPRGSYVVRFYRGEKVFAQGEIFWAGSSEVTPLTADTFLKFIQAQVA